MSTGSKRTAKPSTSSCNKGILTQVDHLFWNLPFCSVKQSQAVRKKAGVTEEEWSTKWKEIVAEHDLPDAREQLASG